jgi:hypothetical protein
LNDEKFIAARAIPIPTSLPVIGPGSAVDDGLDSVDRAIPIIAFEPAELVVDLHQSLTYNRIAMLMR